MMTAAPAPSRLCDVVCWCMFSRVARVGMLVEHGLLGTEGSALADEARTELRGERKFFFLYHRPYLYVPHGQPWLCAQSRRQTIDPAETSGA